MERTRDLRGANGAGSSGCDDSRRTRRGFLAAAGAVGLPAVAGCLGGGESTATEGADATADGSGMGTPTDGTGGMTSDGRSERTPDSTSAMGTATDGTGGMGTTSAGSTGDGTDASGSMGDVPSWYGRELRDVTGDGTFTIGGFDRPVVLETFAVWCPVCTSQQEELAALRSRRDDLVVVSLNVDPNESASKVRSHASDHGFDWRYAVAPADLTSTLVDEFGAVVTNAPSAPVVVACQDGSASLVDQRGVKSADTVGSHVDDC